MPRPELHSVGNGQRQDEFNGTARMQNRRFNLGKEKPAPLNWRRGMYRLWILVSGAWMMGWLIYFAIEFINGGQTSRSFLVVPVVLFVPPLALLLFGIATRWAFQGFESDSQGS